MQDPAEDPQAQASAYPAAPLEVLDSCHRQIVQVLKDLRSLALHMHSKGPDDDARALARRIHLCLGTVAGHHHQDEERHVFPVLLRQGDAELAEQVLRLQRQHAWLERDWLALAPQLDAAARGYAWRDIEDVAARVDAFSTLYLDHITLEESVVFPRARQLLSAQELHEMSVGMTQRRR